MTRVVCHQQSKKWDQSKQAVEDKLCRAPVVFGYLFSCEAVAPCCRHEAAVVYGGGARGVHVLIVSCP